MADVPASRTLHAAAELVDGWPEPYAAPLAELLRAEAVHATRLEREDCDWDRYPPGGCLLRLAQGVVDDDRSRGRRQPRICNNPDQHPPGCDCGSR